MSATAAQPTLFDAPAELPHGLRYQPGFLSTTEERELLVMLGALPFREATFQQYTARRRVVRFGDHYDADAREWVCVAELPPFLSALRVRVAGWLGVAPESFIHALTTEYRPGTPIGWHRDKPEYGTVVGISLAGAARMRFRPLDGTDDRSRVVALELEPRSIYVMRDEIRWHWHHSIPPTKALRYSITLRTASGEAAFPRTRKTWRGGGALGAM